MGNSLVAEFRSDVTDVDILQRLVRLHIADLNHKGVRSMVLPFNVQLGHYHGMVGSPAQRANPPFGGRQRWAVDGKCLVRGVPGSSSFQSPYIGSVTQLSLCIAPNDLVLQRSLIPKLLLFGCCLISQCNLDRG